MDILLKGKWEGMKGALLAGDIEEALDYFTEDAKEKYRPVFNILKDQMPTILASFVEFNYFDSFGNIVEYEIVADEGEVLYSYPINFIRGEDGIWRFKDF